MNRINKIFAGLLIITGLTFLSSCVNDEFDTPDINIPSVDFESNTTIYDLKNIIYQGILDTITTDVIIQGIVVANDESGNFYKKLMLQDNSGGVEVALDKTDLYTEYRLGQKVYIKCKDLWLGEYGGKVQLGYIYNGDIGRIPEIYINDHLFLDSLPGAIPAPIVKSTFAFTNEELDMLIRLDSVTFETPGEVYSVSTGTTNRNMLDKDGTILILRTSNYANFAGSTMPDGVGTVTGILSYYDGDGFQFYIRDLNDVSGFDNSIKTIVNGNFATAGSLVPFTQYSVIGNELWIQSTYGSDNFAKMSGYNGSYFENEDWLISPSMNFDDYTEEVLKFFTMMNYGTAGDGSLKVFYSTDYSSGDPNASTWTELTGLILSGGAWAKVSSGDIDVSMISGTNIHIAFKYTCSTTNVATWEVGGITVKGKQY
ncbi:MAG: DUF5689 domain-containing protein [Bacteroidota bacterium]